MPDVDFVIRHRRPRFNLSILECKSRYDIRTQSDLFCFNLSILECKLAFIFHERFNAARFNLSILECK